MLALMVAAGTPLGQVRVGGLCHRLVAGGRWPHRAAEPLAGQHAEPAGAARPAGDVRAPDPRGLELDRPGLAEVGEGAARHGRRDPRGVGAVDHVHALGVVDDAQGDARDWTITDIDGRGEQVERALRAIVEFE
jgi:hypothetical protein